MTSRLTNFVFLLFALLLTIAVLNPTFADASPYPVPELVDRKSDSGLIAGSKNNVETIENRAGSN